MANTSGRRTVQYSHLFLFDFTPIPPYQHVSCMPIAKCGLDPETSSNLKLTRAFRLAHRLLDIYEERHTYIIVAKADSDCDNYDRNRAVSLLNDFVYEKLRCGLRIDLLAEQIVDTFDSRLIKLVPYVAKEDKPPQPRPVKSIRKRPVFSSSDADEVRRRMPPLHNPQLNRATTSGGQSHVQEVHEYAEEGTPLPKGARVIAEGKENNVTMHQGLTPTFLETDTTPLNMEGGYELDMTQVRQRESPASTPMSAMNRSASISSPTAGNPHRSLSLAHAPAAVAKPTTARKHRATAPQEIGDSTAQSLLTRMVTADQKGDRRYNRIAGALKFISAEMQSLSSAIQDLKEQFSAVRAASVMTSVDDMVMFPLRTEAEVEAYVERDPNMRQLMERLSHFQYTSKEYPTNCLLAILHEDLFTQVYTWYSKHNTTKKKKRLPKPMQDAIMHVGRIAIKGVPGVTEAQLEAAFRARFSSYNSKKRKLERKKKKDALAQPTDPLADSHPTPAVTTGHGAAPEATPPTYSSPAAQPRASTPPVSNVCATNLDLPTTKDNGLQQLLSQAHGFNETVPDKVISSDEEDELYREEETAAKRRRLGSNSASDEDSLAKIDDRDYSISDTDGGSVLAPSQ